jgi:hypothetical protein
METWARQIQRPWWSGRDRAGLRAIASACPRGLWVSLVFFSFFFFFAKSFHCLVGHVPISHPAPSPTCCVQGDQACLGNPNTHYYTARAGKEGGRGGWALGGGGRWGLCLDAAISFLNVDGWLMIMLAIVATGNCPTWAAQQGGGERNNEHLRRGICRPGRDGKMRRQRAHGSLWGREPGQARVGAAHGRGNVVQHVRLGRKALRML